MKETNNPIAALLCARSAAMAVSAREENET
jgi:hypothetical protein